MKDTTLANIIRTLFFASFGTILVTSMTFSTAMWLYDFKAFNAGLDSPLWPRRMEFGDPFFAKHPYCVLLDLFPTSSFPKSDRGAKLIVQALSHAPYMQKCSSPGDKAAVTSGFVFPNTRLKLEYTTDWRDPTWRPLDEPTKLSSNYLHVRQGGVLTARQNPVPIILNTVSKPPAPRPDGPKGPHVVVVVIDALSRANMMRTMPLVRSRLMSLSTKSDGPVDVATFPLYHTTGLNTPPNEIPMFSGKPQVRGFSTGRRFFPDEEVTTPWVWQQLRGEGWVTSRASQWCREFMSCSLGLEHTDENFDYHYTGGSCDNTRSAPYADIRRTDTICNNGRSDATRMVDWTTNVIAQADSVGRKSFNFMLFEQAHNGASLQAAATVQEAVMHLIDLVEKGDTILVLTADHGLHYGSFSSTAYGTVEARQPPLAILTPRAWATAHSTEVQALHHNKHSIVSAFDIHATLLALGGLPPGPTPGLPLTATLPDNRTCHDAGVPGQWCLLTGVTTKLQDSGQTAEKIRDMAVDRVNAASEGHRDVCEAIVGGDIEFGLERVGPEGATYYQLQFSAAPYKTRWSVAATEKDGEWTMQVTHTSAYARFEPCTPAGMAISGCVCRYAPWAGLGL